MKSKRKRHLRSVQAPGLEAPTKCLKQPEKWSITFTEEDFAIFQDAGNDAIGVSAMISNFKVNRILVDAGSYVEVITYKAYQQLKLADENISPMGPIFGFANQPIPVKGYILLTMTMEDGKHKQSTPVKFLVVDQPSAFTVIIGRPLMKRTQWSMRSTASQ